MEEPCIRVENLTKSFAGRTVVDDLSFVVILRCHHSGGGVSKVVPDDRKADAPWNWH